MTTQSFADQATEASKEQGSSFTAEGQADQAPKASDPTDRAEALFQKYEKRLNDKDEFIGTLKSETKEYREKLAERDAELAELRKQLEAQAGTNEKVDSALKELTQQREVSSKDKADVNLDDVIERATQAMEERLTAKQQAEAETANFNKVESAVKEVYGDKYLESVTARCSELGMSLVELDRLAKVAPQAALDLLKLKAKGTPAPTKSGVNTSAFNQEPQQHKPKTVMGMSNTKKDVDYWRSIKVD